MRLSWPEIPIHCTIILFGEILLNHTHMLFSLITVVIIILILITSGGGMTNSNSS